MHVMLVTLSKLIASHIDVLMHGYQPDYNCTKLSPPHAILNRSIFGTKTTVSPKTFYPGHAVNRYGLPSLFTGLLLTGHFYYPYGYCVPCLRATSVVTAHNKRPINLRVIWIAYIGIYYYSKVFPDIWSMHSGYDGMMYMPLLKF